MREDSKQAELMAAFLDGEMAASEIDQLLEQMECGHWRRTAARQSLGSSCLNGSSAPIVDISERVRLAVRQEAALSAPSVRKTRSFRRPAVPAVRAWWVPAGGMAVAASMAVAAVMVFRPATVAAPGSAAAELAQSETQSLVATSSPAEAQARPAATGVQLASVGNAPGSAGSGRELVIALPQTQTGGLSAQWTPVSVGSAQSAVDAAAQEDAQRRLSAYLLNHARYGGGNALAGSLGYARVAASPQQRAGASSD